MSSEWQWDDTVARPTHRHGKPISGTEHIRFITVDFADLINNLPTVYCAWCDQGITNLRGVYQYDDAVFCDRECYVAWCDSIGDDGPFSDDR